MDSLIEHRPRGFREGIDYSSSEIRGAARFVNDGPIKLKFVIMIRAATLMCVAYLLADCWRPGLSVDEGESKSFLDFVVSVLLAINVRKV